MRRQNRSRTDLESDLDQKAAENMPELESKVCDMVIRGSSDYINAKAVTEDEADALALAVEQCLTNPAHIRRDPRTQAEWAGDELAAQWQETYKSQLP